MRALDFIATQPWATTPETLEMIASIASRENGNPDALAAKLGRPLQNARTATVRGNVAIVPVTGPIFRYANLFTEISGATSLEILARDFSAAHADPQVKSIVLEIDSPGGQAAGIAEMAHMIRAAEKPVIAYVGGMAASAGYWLASAARKIVLSKTGMVGSIGAVLGVSSYTKAGVIEIISSQSPRKRPDIHTSEGRAQLQAQIDALAQVFIEDVSTYRGVSVETVIADFGQGDLRMGTAAVAVGMADSISTLEAVITGDIHNHGGIEIMKTARPEPTQTALELDPIERAARLEWQRDPSLAAEFTGFTSFLAYKRAVMEGRVKVMGGSRGAL